ncbi:MAG TPA: hypothetical protein VKB76_11305 [Ktedonobacterales bacterium]|nr:hypothetical protein [Ktedonobacterales bacterium]
MTDTLARVSMVKQDFSTVWMKENPALLGAAVQKFFEEHPPEKWKLTITDSHLPGMAMCLNAVSKENQ